MLTFVRGVNDKEFDSKNHHVISASTCTGNAFAPFAKFIDSFYGIENGSVCTIHPVLSSEKMIDGFNKSFQLGRAGKSVKLIPTAIANSTIDVLPHLKDRIMIHSLSYRIPTDIVSSIYGVLILKNKVTTNKLIQDLESEIGKNLNGVIELCEGAFALSMNALFDLKIEPGISFVMDKINFLRVASDYDIIITGEGSFDQLSLNGKYFW